jgi:energy-converting hydrogenase Eha subunit E
MPLIFSIIYGFAALILVGTVAGLIAALVTDSDPFRLGLAHIWVCLIFFGLLCLRIAFVAVRMLRARGLLLIDDRGVTNVKDGIGPIAWGDICGASILELPRVPRVGARFALVLHGCRITRRHRVLPRFRSWKRHPTHYPG